MSRITGISLIMALLLAGSGCGGGYSAPQSARPTPSPTPSPAPSPTPSLGPVAITAISPTSASAGSPDLTLTITGSNLKGGPHDIRRAVWSVSGSTTNLATTPISDTQLTAVVPAALLGTPVTAHISIEYGDPMGDVPLGRSNSVPFSVTATAATTAVSPAADTLGPNGTRQFTASINGSSRNISWDIQEGSAGGAINPTGLYTAPANVGNFHVVATLADAPSESAIASVAVVSSGFTETGSMHSARSSHTATLLKDGRVIIVGGAADNTAELFDPTNAAFSFTGSLIASRSRASATLLSDGRVLIAGGLGLTAGPDGSLPVLDTAEIYDPSTGKFSATGNMQQARWNHVATLLNDGRVLITGGRKGHLCSTASAELFDPTTGTFSSVGFLLSERIGHTGTVLATGEVLVAGGWNGCAPDSSDDPPWDPVFAELFELTSKSFRGSGNMSTTRIAHSAVRLPDGRVLVLGGIPAVQNLHAQPTDPAYAELYEPAGHIFSSVKGLSISHENYTATPLSRGMVLVAGGQDSAGKVTSDVQLLNTDTAGLCATGSLRIPRVGHTATLLQDGRVLVAGGTDASGQTLASAEIYH